MHIQEHLDDALCLEDLVAIACFSPYHFHRIFRGMVGESVKEHIRRLRLERAAYRLKHTNDPVSRLAFEAGYEAHESFTRESGAMFGQSPSEFRQEHRTIAMPQVRCGVHFAAESTLDGFEAVGEGGPPVGARIENRSAALRDIPPRCEAWNWEHSECSLVRMRLTVHESHTRAMRISVRNARHQPRAIIMGCVLSHRA